MQAVFVAVLLSTHHSRVRATTGWLGIRIYVMCPSGETCLLANVVSMS